MTYPDTITTVRLTGRFIAPGGSAGRGRVTFTPSVPVGTAGALLAAPEVAELDSYGRIAVTLLATDDADWAAPGFTYTVREYITGRQPRMYSISVPAAAAGAGLDLATLVPVVAADEVTPYLRAASNLADVDDPAAALVNLGGGFGAYVAAELGAGVTQRAGAGLPASRLEPGNVIRIKGGIDITGNPAAGTELLALTAAHAPVGGTIVHPGIRTGPTGNVSAVLLIATTGVVSLSAAPGTGAYLGLDGITFDRAVV